MKRLLGLSLAIGISTGTALGALRLTVPADNPADVRRQLTFLRHELDRGAGDDAQVDFPEGYFFLYALYGLTEVQLGLGEPPADRADELRKARRTSEQIESDKGRAPFDPGLKPAYGIFYRGWANWQPEPTTAPVAPRVHDYVNRSSALLAVAARRIQVSSWPRSAHPETRSRTSSLTSMPRASSTASTAVASPLASPLASPWS